MKYKATYANNIEKESQEKLSVDSFIFPSLTTRSVFILNPVFNYFSYISLLQLFRVLFVRNLHIC